MHGKGFCLAALLGIGSTLAAGEPDALRDPREVRLAQVRQLTRGPGSNAEAYWSFDGSRIVFQSTREGHPCDQLFVMAPDGSGQTRVSNGQGRVTCGYFLPDGRLLYASTHAQGAECPATPPFTPGRYVWPVHPTYDLYLADPDGRNAKPFLPAEGYDAEATVAPNGRWIVFTSERGGDVELWRADLDGRNLLRLTRGVGYDGGAVFSPDSTRIAWRTNYPAGTEATARYQDLLRRHLVEPMEMDLWVMEADGRNPRQVTRLGGAAFAPVFTPDGKSLVFASNHHDRGGKGRTFDLFKVDLDGGGLEQITFTGTFNSFPHFSPDGRRLLWCSGRNGLDGRNFNVFVAEWVPAPVTRPGP
jgi:TolB protein